MTDSTPATAASGWGKDAGYHEHQIRRFFRSGFPPEELAALLSVLDPGEVEWINHDDS